MLPWETDPSMRDNELGAAFAASGARSRRSSSAARLTAFRATLGSRVIYERYERARDE